MITFDQVTVHYDDAAQPALREVDLTVEEGELCLVVGHTGVGKSTLLGAVNGLVPHFTGGTLYGRVTVDGRDTAHHPPRELADVVGVVGQDPIDGFVTDTVEEELAYAMEQLAIPTATMRKRVEETLDLLGLADLRHRALHELSGGQQQRVAIGSVLTAHPRVLVLDEPTSALDPTAAEEVLSAVTRLVHDLGVTVLMAEHRLERVVQYADRVVCLPGDGRVVSGSPADILRTASIAPPSSNLAGPRAGPRCLCRSATPGVPQPPAHPPRRPHSRRGAPAHRPGKAHVTRRSRRDGQLSRRPSGPGGRPRSPQRRDHRAHGPQRLRKVLTAVGTSGIGTPPGGSVKVDTGDGSVSDPHAVSAAEARRIVGLVPQTPADLLYLESVKQELDQADWISGTNGSDATPDGAGESARQILDRLAPGIDDGTHPRDLSEGQKLALVLAIQLSAAPRVLLLDEPTRGLDYRAKEQLIRIVDALASEGAPS